jgi:mRNA (guanine-N7-)-methyltransferase
MEFKNLRKFHNRIKERLITEYVTKPSKLLDLACGVGGDLSKWNKNKFITEVVGYDINKKSIVEANRRLNTLSNLNTRVKFHVKDLSVNCLKLKKFDVISIQFAFHYFFKDSESFECILKTMTNSSKPGTLVLMTLLDSNLLKNIKNSNLELKILDPKDKSDFGNEISVWLKKTVLDIPTVEYRVRPEFLIQKMKDHGYKLVSSKNFREFDLPQKRFLTKDEKKYSFMNNAYVFEYEGVSL